MRLQTKHFGEIELDEDKIITFDRGIMGFEELKSYTILYDIEEEGQKTISWLQSTQEPGLAIPIVSPSLIDEKYNPTVEDELLQSIGELNDENTVIFLTITVPSVIEKMSVNLKAPFVINSDTKKGIQIIAENPEYQVKYNVYEALKNAKKKGDE